MDTQTMLRQRAVVTVPEAAQILGLAKNYTYQLVASGQLPSVRFGRAIRVPTAELRRLLEDNRLATETVA